MVAVAALMAACDEYTLPNPPAQSNNQEPVFETSGLSVTDLTDGKLDLVTFSQNNTQPELLRYSVSNVPEGRALKFVMEISDTEDFAKSAEVATTSGEDSVVRASVYDIETAYSTTFSRSPEAVTLYTRYAAYVSNTAGTENVRVGGPDYYLGATSLAFTPVLRTHTVENAYYLVGSFNGWQIASAQLMQKDEEGNPYDHPDFHTFVEVTADMAANGGLSWKIIPESAYKAGNWEGAFGVVATDSESGRLVESPEAEVNAGVIADAGKYQISVNMYEDTYKVSLAYEHLWIQATGYYQTVDKMLRLYTSDYVNYGGVMRCAKGFKFLCQPDLNTGVFYGVASDSETTTKDGVTSGTMERFTEAKDARNMEVPARATYYVKANLKNLKWSAAELSSISIVGAFNDWNVEDEAATMTPDRNGVVYTITGVEMPAGEFKFCANHAWTISFGGEMDNIVENGGNLTLDVAGTYDITLDFTTVPPSAKAVLK